MDRDPEDAGPVIAAGALYGTACTITETLEELIQLGCEGFLVYSNSAPTSDALRRLFSPAPAKRRRQTSCELQGPRITESDTKMVAHRP